MKIPQKIGLGMALALGLSVGCIKWTRADETRVIGAYEYWVGNGSAGGIALNMKEKLAQGFEVDRLEMAPMPSGYTEPYMVVVLRKLKH